MLRTDFAYDLPPELIAQAPLPERSAGRMLVLDRQTGAFADRWIRDLPDFLSPGDLLVLNDTRVVAARVFGTKPSGGRVEILLERAVGEREALVQMRASKPVRDGLEISTPGGTVQVLAREDDLWRIRLPAPVLDFFERWGQVPLPPYIQRAASELDQQRYQTIFARERGAVAAPTASLHFDQLLLAKLEARKIGLAFVTLHVGAGTFQPVRADDLESHVMHSERAVVGAATCEAILRARAAGRRVIAAGTTVVRALESAALSADARGEPTAASAASAASVASPPSAASAASFRLAPWSGETRLFIKPGFRFRVADALLTNFHLPESTLLMLVCAFAGREPVLRAYQHAVAARYRFFSYGDAMLVTTQVSA
ncbi:MAG TPA: tRNA preQ1(34) S-adenosylmethionine ribosyltransferase-isomerase QueA [Steroidobacteraceae bacterium]|nr:tRNA preQ1(34) S-adenosylmethionine ribosyltransferase-isomerase QueA [Steroidobacteraceae bacterium]